MDFAGIDIGGANIKFAISTGQSRQIAFPIWKEKQRLPSILADLATELTRPTCLGVTMTAELADCFESKQAGVEFIVKSVGQAFSANAPMFYRTDGAMCDEPTAIQDWRAVAAANWHALAWFAFYEAEESSGFMFDIGSTTTDIVPVEDGMPVVPGQDDFTRLSNQQLFYAGMERTPVCSLLGEVVFESCKVTIARELFATMQDVFLWLGEVEPSNSIHTADGRPATRVNAGRRLARMVCAGPEDLLEGQVDAIAIQARSSLFNHLSIGVQSVVVQYPHLPLRFLTFGGGAWFAKQVINSAFADREVKPVICSFSHDETMNQTAAARAVAKKRELQFAENGVEQNAS